MDKLLELQLHWYKLLECEGFKDAEYFDGKEFVLKQTTSKCYARALQYNHLATEEYFRLINELVNNPETIFKTEVDRIVLLQHSKGAKIKQIVDFLKELGTPRHRHSVRFIIRKYEMLWNIRFYDRTQLYFRKS